MIDKYIFNFLEALNFDVVLTFSLDRIIQQIVFTVINNYRITGYQAELG